MTDQPKLTPAQEKSLLSGLANTQTRVLEGRPVTNRALVNLGLAYHAPTRMRYILNEAGIAVAEKLREAERAEQFKEDAAAVENFRPKGTRPVYARDLKEGMRVHDGAFGFRTVEAVKTYEEGPYENNHWTKVTLGPATVGDTAHPMRVSTSSPDHIRFVEQPQQRPAAEILADDPIPAGISVLEGMPGEQIGREGVSTRDAVTHEEYVIQIRDRGRWILPNHDDGAHMTRAQVVGAMARVRSSAPNRSRASIDADRTVYLSNGLQAARYIPAVLIEGCHSDVCPGCGTAYATNGDGPCKEVD